MPVERNWRLNERHYGALQGLDKAQTVAEHGEAQVKIWRRSYDVAPPPLAPELTKRSVMRPHLPAVDHPGELQHAVSERGLAVVDVGDDAEVADLRRVGAHGRHRRRRAGRPRSSAEVSRAVSQARPAGRAAG